MSKGRSDQLEGNECMLTNLEPKKTRIKSVTSYMYQTRRGMDFARIVALYIVPEFNSIDTVGNGVSEGKEWDQPPRDFRR